MSISSPQTQSPSRSFSISNPSSSRNNPISLRIYKAIGTSFDDPASREALEIASSFYAPSKGKGKALDGVDGEEEGAGGEPMRRTLKGQSAAMARKYLKRDVEARLAGGSRQFLEAFGEVDKVSLVEPPCLLLWAVMMYVGALVIDLNVETRCVTRTYARNANPL